MKLKRFTAVLLAGLVAFSCSDNDEDKQPDVESASLSFSSEQQVVAVPNAMLTSEDPYAQMAAGWVTLANSMTASLSLFTPPASATKSTERINASNARTKAGSSVVYTWSDPQYGSIAYQISDASSKYTFELFLKPTGETEWLRYLYAEEQKDKSRGYMEVYNDQSSAGDALMTWEWERSGDNFQLTLTDATSEFYFVLEINTGTKAGSIMYYEGAEKTYEMTWDAQGKGSWVTFVDGEESAEGSW